MRTPGGGALSWSCEDVATGCLQSALRFLPSCPTFPLPAAVDWLYWQFLEWWQPASGMDAAPDWPSQMAAAADWEGRKQPVLSTLPVLS